MEPKCKQLRDLQLPTNVALQDPFTFHLDEALGRLFIGEFEGRRVLVFDNVFDFDFD
jgi:hypothetical protein